MTPADRLEAAARRAVRVLEELRAALADVEAARAERPVGRHDRVRALYERGLSDEEIAAELGVGVATAAQYRRAAGLPADRRRIRGLADAVDEVFSGRTNQAPKKHKPGDTP